MTSFEEVQTLTSSAEDFLDQSEMYTTPTTLKKNVLVLDLDEILIYAGLICFSPYCKSMVVNYFGKDIVFSVAPRPGLFSFLEEIKNHYTIYLFTTKESKYAISILKGLGIYDYFDKIFDRSYCLFDKKHGLIKNLEAIGVPMENLILVENSLTNVKLYPHNRIEIEAFLGDFTDNQLKSLSDFLKSLSEIQDVRPAIAVRAGLLKEEDLLQTEAVTQIAYLIPETEDKKFMSGRQQKKCCEKERIPGKLSLNSSLYNQEVHRIVSDDATTKLSYFSSHPEEEM